MLQSFISEEKNWGVRCTLSRTVPHLLIGNWLRMDYAGNEACFPEAFTNALVIYLLGQRSRKTVCCAAACEGNDQWQP